MGEGFVIPNREENLTWLIEELTKKVVDLDWRLQEFTLMPVKELPEGENA